MKKKIGIYGGTFSPPHIGHVSAAESFSRSIALDELLIMPDFLPPHKQIDGLVSEYDRLEMCKRAFSHIDKAKVSDFEIKKGGRSYTAVTLEEFASDERELYFLCGTDMFLTLDTWYRPETIFNLATICYIRRECDLKNDVLLEEKSREYIQRFSAKIIPIPASVVEVSSSELRQALRTDPALVKNLLSEEVYDYIVEKRLYL